MDVVPIPEPSPGMSERELVDAIRGLEELKARACAIQAELALRLDQTVRERHQQARVPAARRGRDVAGLIGYARRESPAKGSRLLGLAHALREQPHTWAAMRAGALSEWRAALISRETACLSRTDRALVDAQLSAPDAEGGYRFDGWGDRRLIAQTQQLVYAVDATRWSTAAPRPRPTGGSRCDPPPTPWPS